jgi:hypothetical protein
MAETVWSLSVAVCVPAVVDQTGVGANVAEPGQVVPSEPEDKLRGVVPALSARCRSARRYGRV